MKKLILIFSICTFAWLGIAGCGDDDCPTCPEPPNNGHYSGLAYLSEQFGFKGFYTYDTDSGAIVDSTMQLGYAAGTSVNDLTADGKYLSVWYGDTLGIETRIYETATMRVVHVLSNIAISNFTEDGKFLIGNRGRAVSKFLVPSFNKVFEDTIIDDDARYRVHSPNRSIFAVAGNYKIYQISYDSMKIVHQWTPVDEQGIPIFMVHFDVHPNGNLLYSVGSSGSTRFFVYDLTNSRLIASFPLVSYWGDLRVNPDGSEVWVTDPGRVEIPFAPPDVGTVFIFDAYTGAHSGGISLYGYIADDPAEPLDAKRVDFSPDGKEAYITTGALGPRENLGTILRFDARSRKLISNIFPNIDRSPHGVVVGPRP